MEHNSESDSSSRKSGNPKPEMAESLEISCVRPGEQRPGTTPPQLTETEPVQTGFVKGRKPLRNSGTRSHEMKLGWPKYDEANPETRGRRQASQSRTPVPERVETQDHA
jgi:hypothetical protein